MSDSVRPQRRQPTRSPVLEILQARTLEWVAISFSRAWQWKVNVKSLSHVRLLVTPWTAAYQAPPSMGFARQEYWSGLPLPSPLLGLTKITFTIFKFIFTIFYFLPFLFLCFLFLIFFINNQLLHLVFLSFNRFEIFHSISSHLYL